MTATERAALNISRERKSKGWRLRDLAQRVEDRGVPMTLNTLSKIERGARGISVQELVAISGALGVGVLALLGDPVARAAAGELLTAEERQTIRLLAEVADLFALHVIANGLSSEHDLAEAFSHIHALQHAVMAQAAARAYPDTYRLLGATLPIVPVVGP